MMFVSFNSSTKGVTSGAGTANPSEAHEFTTVFSGFCGVTRPLVFCVVFCTYFFVLFFFFFWSLCCLSLFKLRILITPLASSSFC